MEKANKNQPTKETIEEEKKRRKRKREREESELMIEKGRFLLTQRGGSELLRFRLKRDW